MAQQAMPCDVLAVVCTRHAVGRRGTATRARGLAQGADSGRGRGEEAAPQGGPELRHVRLGAPYWPPPAVRPESWLLLSQGDTQQERRQQLQSWKRRIIA